MEERAGRVQGQHGGSKAGCSEAAGERVQQAAACGMGMPPAGGAHRELQHGRRRRRGRAACTGTNGQPGSAIAGPCCLVHSSRRGVVPAAAASVPLLIAAFPTPPRPACLQRARLRPRPWRPAPWPACCAPWCTARCVYLPCSPAIACLLEFAGAWHALLVRCLHQ